MKREKLKLELWLMLPEEVEPSKDVKYPDSVIDKVVPIAEGWLGVRENDNSEITSSFIGTLISEGDVYLKCKVPNRFLHRASASDKFNDKRYMGIVKDNIRKKLLEEKTLKPGCSTEDSEGNKHVEFYSALPKGGKRLSSEKFPFNKDFTLGDIFQLTCDFLMSGVTRIEKRDEYESVTYLFDVPTFIANCNRGGHKFTPRTYTTDLGDSPVIGGFITLNF